MPKKDREKKAGLLGRIVLFVFAVYAAMMLLSLQGQINRAQAENNDLQERLTAQRMLNATLAEDTGSEAGRIARLARERLGLALPGEIIIRNRTP